VEPRGIDPNRDRRHYSGPGLRRTGSPFVGLIRATHLLPAATVTALIGLVVAARGADAATLIWAVASTAAGQGSVGWSNDYIDRHRDRAAGRTDKPLVAGDVSPRTVQVAAVVALVASPLLSIPLGMVEAAVMLIAVASAWSYNLGLKATVLSWLPYAVSFGLAPAYIWMTTGDRPPAWLVAAGTLLGVGAHLMNTVPDLAADRVGQVRGLPHRLGLRGSLLLASGILAAALILVLVAGGAGSWSWAPAALAGGLIVAVVWTGFTGRTGMGFKLTIAAAGAIVLTLVASPAGLR
jgi:4-hydroxybenzoate polyprenyltransferase